MCPPAEKILHVLQLSDSWDTVSNIELSSLMHRETPEDCVQMAKLLRKGKWWKTKNTESASVQSTELISFKLSDPCTMVCLPSMPWTLALFIICNSKKIAHSELILTCVFCLYDCLNFHFLLFGGHIKAILRGYLFLALTQELILVALREHMGCQRSNSCWLGIRRAL